MNPGDTENETETTAEFDSPSTRKADWNWHPELPITNAKMFVWPPKPVVGLKELASYWFTLTGRVVILLTTLVCWFLFEPFMVVAANMEFGWVAHIYFRNIALLVIFASSLHWYFYSYKGQGEQFRYEARDLARNAKIFTFDSQLLDNIFWSIVSGVTLWTLYEVAFIWAYANNLIWSFEWREHPVWFIALFVLIPIWYSFYFYWIHRAEHWPPFYKSVHSVHHRNVDVGPWSGLSMHPVEHLLYFGSVLIHLLVPSHPLHVIFHLQFAALIAVLTHCGYEQLVVKDKKIMGMGYFFHQLHHRYFDCNYGTDEMPWDKWLGTFHDGTPEATASMRKKRQRSK